MTGTRWLSRPVSGLVAILPLGVVIAVPPLLGGGAPTSVPDPAVGHGVAVTVVAVIVAAGVVGLTRWVPSRASRMAVAVAGALAAAGSVIAVGRAAAPASGAVTVAAACVGALWGVAAYVVHGADEPSAADVLAGIPERDRVVRPVAPDEGAPRRQDAAWQVSVRLPRMRGLALFGGLVFGATAWLSWGTTPGWWTALVGLAGALFCAVMLAWSSVLVRVDPTGLMVRSMVFPVSLMTVAASDVLGAGSVEVDPMDWGGWGLQWSARHTAVVVRGGPGIVVHRRSGRPLALEVPAGAVAASEGAALLRRVAGWAAPC